jgi:dipeptidyl-peptidase-4
MGKSKARVGRMDGSSNSAEELATRYARAVTRTPVASASRTAGNSVEGYWISEYEYYFLAEHFDPSLDRIVSTPTLVDAHDGVSKPLVDLETIASEIGRRRGRLFELDDLASAEFDLPQRNCFVVYLDEHAYRFDVASQTICAVDKIAKQPALYAPDGRNAVYLENYDLIFEDRLSEERRPLTTDGREALAYGREVESSLSVISYRRNPTPVGLWSHDSQWFLTQRVDERNVPSLQLLENIPSNGGRPILHSYRYPVPGDPRPIITFIAIHIVTGRMISVEDFPVLHQIFSPFVERSVWFSLDDQALYFVRAGNHHHDLELVELDLATGVARIAMSETTTDGYLELHPLIASQPNIRVLRETDELVWYSERDGWGHLYLYSLSTGALKARITEGSWLVRDIVHIDVTTRRIMFLASGIDQASEPGRRVLCSACLDGGALEIVLEHDGEIAVAPDWTGGIRQDRPYLPSYASAGASPGGAYVVARRSALDDATRLILLDLSSGTDIILAQADPGPGPRTPARPFETLAADGKTKLFGALFLPVDFDETRSYPLVDFIYPGPQVSWLPRSFRTTKEALAQALAELGFVTMILDSRGVPLRSREFHQAGYGQLLEPQLADHAATVTQLCARHPFLDAHRVGIMGMSGGGYATARALLAYPDIFTVGVSACGNHDSRLYHGSWLEKYAGPLSVDRWESLSNIPSAPDLRGKLLLITGDMDDNVHPAQTLALVDALIKANKDFDFLMVPNADHDIFFHPYVLRRTWDYFVQHLLGCVPPAGFEICFSDNELATNARVSKRAGYFA